MDGELSAIDKTSYHLGYKIYGICRVHFVFTSGMGSGNVVNLTGLRQICTGAEIVVVLTPVSQIDDVLLEGRLRQDRVVQIALAPNKTAVTFEIPFERLLAGFLKPSAGQGSPYPELSTKQADDYKEFEYKCFDRVHIPGSMPMKRSNVVEVNGTDVTIPDYIFPLFVRLVLELKQGAGGWIDRYTLVEEGILEDPDKLQIFSNLRNAVKGGLPGRDVKEFIYGILSPHMNSLGR
jgi:hypothetical protein